MFAEFSKYVMFLVGNNVSVSFKICIYNSLKRDERYQRDSQTHKLKLN